MQIVKETFMQIGDEIVFKVIALVPEEDVYFTCKKKIHIDRLELTTLNRKSVTGSDNWQILATFFKELMESKFQNVTFDLNEIGKCIDVERTNYEIDNNIAIKFRYSANGIVYNCKIWYDEQDYSFECKSGSSIIERNYDIPKLFKAYLRKNNFAIK